MERLTLPRNRDGTVSQPTNLDWYAVLDKLTRYEDTGLQPEEIMHAMRRNSYCWRCDERTPTTHITTRNDFEWKGEQFCYDRLVALCSNCREEKYTALTNEVNMLRQDEAVFNANKISKEN